MWTIFKIILLILIIPFQVFAQNLNLINPVAKNIPDDVQSIFKNRSIMSCGERTGLSVYTSLDIQAILAISNMLSSETIPLETNWETFSPLLENVTSASLNEKDVLKYPHDVQRIIYYCLTWDESYRLKLYDISQEVLDSIAANVIKEKPWKVLPKTIADRINKFSRASIRDFVYLILRSNIYFSIRGDFSKNPTLWATSFIWRTPVTSLQNKESSDKQGD
ncbi:hypothetical protein [Silvanigrella aquatica]|uniref:Uncharacterized protein n=1 Tax=Silvanigrella aquatica TaxID=1915309 RepID=A0A1L4CX84_9BACT|nr:hypothetical protein [Silvanigrella aquatica]APJ02549.1 hypothetical protein AXG55_00810 [Silvanigrella aquatica]